MTCSGHPTSKPHPIVGYTTRRHLLLDLDNVNLTQAVGLTQHIQQSWPKVGDTLIVRSSTKPQRQFLVASRWQRPILIHHRHSYHLVFDNAIGYNQCCTILEVLADLQTLERDYLKIRQFRGDMTLRISPMWISSGVKPVPTPVRIIRNPWTRKHDGYIARYLNALAIATQLFNTDNQPEAETHKRTDSTHTDSQQLLIYPL